MAVPPFLEQIPDQFRKDPLVHKFVENLYRRFNQQIIASNTIASDLDIISQSVGSGGGSTEVVYPNPESFLEVRVESSPVDAISETFYYATGNFSAVFSIVLPEFPPEDFYIRAQVFDNKSFFFLVNQSAKTINGSPSAQLSGNGNLADIKYSLAQDRYILT